MINDEMKSLKTLILANIDRRRNLVNNRSATTMRPVSLSSLETSCPSVDLYAGDKFRTFFDIQGGGQLRCGSTYMRVYAVCEFSGKINLAPCEENCEVH